MAALRACAAAREIRRIGVLMNIAENDPGSETSGIGQLTAIQTLAPSFGVEITPVDARDSKEIECAVSTIARNANVGLIVTLSGSAIVHRKLLIALADRHQLPAVYPRSLLR